MKKENGEPRWLNWAREIQAISQTGITYSETEYNVQRYQRLQEIAAEIINLHTGLPTASLIENFQIQRGYATPKIDVRGAVVRNNEILLVHERADGLWCMPGGWADVGEIPSEMVSREVLEESGFQVKPHKIVGVYDANRTGRPLEFYHAYKIVFLCEIIGGEARPSNETEAVAFFKFHDLPPLSSNRTNQKHLSDISINLKNPDHPTIFD